MLSNKRSLLKMLSVLTMIILSIFMLTGCGKKEKNNEEQAAENVYLQPVTDYFEGIKNKDINQVLKAFPEFTKMSEKITADDINDLYAQYEALYGANIKIDYSFGEATALSEEDISEIESEISTVYTDVENIYITAAYTVPVTVTITGDGIQENIQNGENTEGTENAESAEENPSSNVEQDEMYVLQYNGNWYIM
ncbi:MAG: hypothetical protein J6A89_04250 [Clostridia bacterium]|nr:hypothetical protein [Clostridia bacterium]